MSGDTTYPVMTTQTWAYIKGQLDTPRSRWIKIHILRADELRSYCGLKNNDDVGDMTITQLNANNDTCKKCLKLAQPERQRHEKSYTGTRN